MARRAASSAGEGTAGRGPEEEAEGQDIVEIGSFILARGYDDGGHEQCECCIRITAVYRPTSGGQWARGQFVASSDSYWNWWIQAPPSAGGAGRVLYHFCNHEYCAAAAPTGVQAIHINKFEEFEVDGMRDFFVRCKAADPSLIWPTDLGDEPEDLEAELPGEGEVDEIGMPLEDLREEAPPGPSGPPGRADPRRQAARQPPRAGGAPAAVGARESPLVAAGARLGLPGPASARPPVEELRGRLDRLRESLDPTGGARGLSGGGVPQKRQLAHVLGERAEKMAKKGPGKVTDLDEPPAGLPSAAGARDADPLLQRLLEVVADRGGSSDILQGLLAARGGVADGDVPRTLASKRGHFRQVAAKCPGLLSEQALAKMSEFVYTQTGDDEGDHAPIFLKYLLNVFIPQNPIKNIGVDVYREMRTVCEAADALVSGKTIYALDILAQRFKALQMYTVDKSWSGARWLELIPPSNEQLALRAEDEEIVRTVELGELRLEELLSKLKRG